MIMAQTPEWAEQLAAETVKAYGLDMPEIKWRQSEDSERTSGRVNRHKSELVITAGSDEQDQKMALLHELAHWVTTGHHDTEFWVVAFDLYEQHGLSQYAIGREGDYMAGAMAEAKSRGLIKAEVEIMADPRVKEYRPLTKAKAQALVDQVKQGIDLIIPAVIELYQRRAWVPLDYDSWEDLCAAEFSALMQFRLPKPKRAEVHKQMADAGMTTRESAAATGYGNKTVARDLNDRNLTQPSAH
jgi:hypothetical protein